MHTYRPPTNCGTYFVKSNFEKDHYVAVGLSASYASENDWIEFFKNNGYGRQISMHKRRG